MSKFTRSQKKGKLSSYTGRFLKKRLELSRYPRQLTDTLRVDSFVTMPKSTAVIMKVMDAKGNTYYFPSPSGVARNTTFNSTSAPHSVELKHLREFQIGDLVCNVEFRRYSRNFLFRASGASGKVIRKTEDRVTLERQQREIPLSGDCLAMRGVIGNAGRELKPLVKAGTASKVSRSRGKKYPKVSSHKMNAQDSPIGGSYRKSRGRPMTVSRNAPPGAKFGSIAARRTGRKKR